MGTKRYSSDLPQGGMEIPCIYVFRGNETDKAKVNKFMSVLFPDGLESSLLSDSSKSEPVRKKQKVEEEGNGYSLIVLWLLPRIKVWWIIE